MHGAWSTPSSRSRRRRERRRGSSSKPRPRARACLGEREVANAAAAASNDAAGAAVRDSDFYRQGRVVIDATLAEAVARRSVGARGERYLHDVRVDVEADGDRVRVTVSGRVDYLFSSALPGGPHHADVQASATATAERGG